MLLDDYLSDIQNGLNEITPLLVNHSLTIDKRPQGQAHIFGMLIFADESVLHFREFIDASEGWIDKVAYSYHFQDKSNTLLFRYDNAKHKPALAFAEHKHIGDKIIFAAVPNLAQVVQEAIVMQRLV